MIHLTHHGHMGIKKTKQLLREKVWFPGIGKAVEKLVKGCIPCQAVLAEVSYTPIEMTELPGGPWQELAVDFTGPFLDGRYLLVLLDEYSRFPVVRSISSLEADKVIAAMQDIFALFGIPVKVIMDNGPPFAGHKFKCFRSDLGIRHHLVAPLWPQANGEVDRFMRTINKTAWAGKQWKVELEHVLLNYRATPHSTTGKSPGKLLFGRQIRTYIPEVTVSPDDTEI